MSQWIYCTIVATKSTHYNYGYYGDDNVLIYELDNNIHRWQLLIRRVSQISKCIWMTQNLKGDFDPFPGGFRTRDHFHSICNYILQLTWKKWQGLRHWGTARPLEKRITPNWHWGTPRPLENRITPIWHNYSSWKET